MMKPKDLLKVKISTTERHLKSLIQELYEGSIMHVEGVMDEKGFAHSSIKPQHPPKELKKVVEMKTQLLKIHTLREELKSEKMIHPSLKESFGAEDRKVKSLPEGIEREISYVKKASKEILKKFNPIKRKIEGIKTRQERYKDLLFLIEPLRDFPLPIKLLLGESRIDVKFLISKEPAVIENFLDETKSTYYRKKGLNVKQNEWMYAVYYLRDDKELFKSLFKRRLTVEYQVSRDGIRKVLSEFRGGIEDLDDLYRILWDTVEMGKDELKKLAEIFDKIWGNNKEIYRATLEELAALEEKLSGWKLTGRSRYLCFFWGWVDKEKSSRLKMIVKSVTQGQYAIEFKKPMVKEKTPTLLDNGRFFRPFQPLIEMYGMPNYRSIDPTIIVGLFFTLFIGLMIGDAGYGLILIILSIIFKVYVKNNNEKLASFTYVGLIVGSLTFLSGIAMGTFFGDFIPRFVYHDPTKPLYSAYFLGVHLPVDPMRNPMSIFALSLVLGLIQMNIGFILGFFQRWFLQKNRKGAITGYISWFLIEIGGGALVGDYFINLWSLTHTQVIIFTLIFFAGFALLSVESGIFSFFDLEGFPGDWVSYSRILALGLATSGMASAINILGQLIMVGQGPVKIFLGIVGVLMLFFGHLLNTGLQTLGAIVHSLRLQYAEFMGKFYEGDGKPFHTFGRRRIFTSLQDKGYGLKEVKRDVGE